MITGSGVESVPHNVDGLVEEVTAMRFIVLWARACFTVVGGQCLIEVAEARSKSSDNRQGRGWCRITHTRSTVEVFSLVVEPIM